ncbi:MAG: hypothetical protein ACXV4A_01285 [Actinomycetes bacterium]
MAGSPRRHGDDSGGIVLGWLTRITVILAIAGLALFDAISIGSTAVTLSDEGDYAAREASENWLATKSVQQAYDAAVAAAISQNSADTVDTKSFKIDPDGTVHLTIAREAPTLVVYRFSQTRKWAQISRPGSGRSVAG